MSIQERAELTAELALINKELQDESLSWENSLELRDAAHNIEMKLNGVKTTDSHIDCIGCGS